jgi:hypothetical protein
MQLKEQDYPCNYLDSNIASLKSQSTYKGLIWTILVIMLFSTVLSSISTQHITSESVFNKINGYVLLVSCFGSVFLTYLKPEKNWYIGRAVAESIKTLSWKYMMLTDPFNIDNDYESRELFITRCAEIMKAAMEKDNFVPKLNCHHKDFVTEKMIAIRALSFLERKNIYATERIENQISWYTTKSELNQKKGNIWTVVLAGSQFIAATYLIFIQSKPLGVDFNTILIFIATSSISILEMNKFRELTQSYAFTAFELNTIRNRFGLITNENELDNFVDDAEQAISREHTMWLARRGK